MRMMALGFLSWWHFVTFLDDLVLIRHFSNCRTRCQAMCNINILKEVRRWPSDEHNETVVYPELDSFDWEDSHLIDEGKKCILENKAELTPERKNEVRMFWHEHRKWKGEHRKWKNKTKCNIANASRVGNHQCHLLHVHVNQRSDALKKMKLLFSQSHANERWH